MGSYTSKLFSHHDENETRNKPQTNESPSDDRKIKLCTPPMTKRKLTTDPRSTTIGIVRTPIEVVCTPPPLGRRVASALPKYLQTKRYLETDFNTILPATLEKCIVNPRSPNMAQERTRIVMMPISDNPSSVVTVKPTCKIVNPTEDRTATSALDPRSPPTDFDRTPILKQRFTSAGLTTSSENAVSPVVNENGITILSYCETTTDFNIPEIQAILEPAPIIDESFSLENRPNTFEMLEDSISSYVSSKEMSDCSESEEQVTVIRNPTVFPSLTDVSSIPKENIIIENNGNGRKADANDLFRASLNIDETAYTAFSKESGGCKILTTNEKVKIWRDSMSPSANDRIKNVGEKVDAKASIIETNDEIIAKNPRTNNAIMMADKIDGDESKNTVKKNKFQQPIKSTNETGERENVNNEEKHSVPGPNRTPLGNRSNNHRQRPRASTKSPQQLLRNKGLSVQQENTPPTERFASKTKPHGIQWDPDMTVFI